MGKKVEELRVVRCACGSEVELNGNPENPISGTCGNRPAWWYGCTNPTHVGQALAFGGYCEEEEDVCQCLACACGNAATQTDYPSGKRVCDECAVYIVTKSRDVVCGCETKEFTVCHECGHDISWSGILTYGGCLGRPNYKTGSCECGEEAWRDEDRGGWGNYKYASSADD